MPSCDAGSVPKSNSGPPRDASWVTLTTEGAQANTGAITSDHPQSFLTTAMGKWCLLEDVPPATDVAPVVAGLLVPLDCADIGQDSGLGPTQPFFTIIFSCASLVLMLSGGVPQSPAAMGSWATETGSESQ